VGLAGADYEKPFPAADDVAFDGALEKAVPQPFAHNFFKMREHLSCFPAVGLGQYRVCLRVMHFGAAPS
jgi:hypothetical protein